MNLSIISLLMLVCCLSVHGQSIMRGKIISAIDSLPIAYAHILSTESNKGTITNAEGFFELRYFTKNEKSEIIVSCIGYKNQTKNVSAKQEITITLHPYIYTLPEVEISPTDGLPIILKALENREENYFIIPLVYDGFFREFKVTNNQCVRLVEAVISIYDNGNFPNEKDMNNNIHSYQVEKIKLIDKKVQHINERVRKNAYNGITYLMTRNLIKYPQVFFRKDQMHDYDFFVIDTINEATSKVIVIRVKPKETIHEPLPDGKIYIDSKNYAILKLECGVKDNNRFFEKEWQETCRYPDKDTNNFYGCESKFSEPEFQVSFRSFENKLILSHISQKFFSYYYPKEVKPDTMLFTSELMINSVQKVKKNPFKKRELMDNSKDVYYQDAQNDELNWDNINIIAPSQLQKKFMESGITQ